MRKEVLFAIIMLLLTLTLLPIPPIVAVGPPPKEQANVEFTGPDIMSEVMTLDIRGGIVHSCYRPYVTLTFVETTQGLWSVDDTLNFAGDQESKFGFHIDKRTGETWMEYKFGEYTQEDVDEGIIIDRYIGWRKYQLEGYGQWEGESIPYGTIAVDGEFTIDQMFYTSTSKGKARSATGVGFEEVWSDSLSFEIIITPPPP